MESMEMQIIIDEEFKMLLPSLDKNTFESLEKNILEYGVRDPLVLWANILIDGYNRYNICTTHNLPFKLLSNNPGIHDIKSSLKILINSLEEIYVSIKS